MVLPVAEFRLRRSLRKKLQAFRRQAAHCEIRIDSAFRDVITACSTKEREGQAGTWIVPEMVDAYTELHLAGHAHSVETWVDGQLVGGLYCVALGRAVFGESVFTHETDASKIALAHLVRFLEQHGFGLIDCQMNTAHLASLGAREIPRDDFIARLRELTGSPPASTRWAVDGARLGGGFVRVFHDSRVTISPRKECGSDEVIRTSTKLCTRRG